MVRSYGFEGVAAGFHLKIWLARSKVERQTVEIFRKHDNTTEFQCRFKFRQITSTSIQVLNSCNTVSGLFLAV
jgi:hypothetical protein